ncbi:MAG: SDR family oxidoreductase [archaeon]
MKENVVVTGGAGFIGSHIARELVKQGYGVKVIDNLFEGKMENISDIENEIEFVKGDIRDNELLEKEFSGMDFVLHQAALRSVIHSMNNPKEYNDVNINGTVNVLEAARNNGVKRVVFASSSSVYGNTTKLPESENDELNPLSPYAVTKLVGERYCKIYSEAFGLETVSLRYFNVFGPMQDPKSEYAVVIPLFIDAIMNDRKPIIFGDGLQSRDFTFVKDVVEGNLVAMKKEGISGEVFNIAKGENIKVIDLVHKINGILGKKVEAKFVSARKGEAKHTQADPEKAKKALGFVCKHEFDEGLRKTVEWFKDN